MMKKELSNILKKSGAFTLLLLVIIILAKKPLLIARNFETKKILRVWDSDKFEIIYTHSVMKSPVTETYYILNGDIYLKESSFKDYGAGLPSSTEYDFKMEDGVFKIYNINEKIYPLVYRTGASVADHRIKILGSQERFLNFSQAREPVEFTVGRVSYFTYLLKGKEEKNE